RAVAEVEIRVTVAVFSTNQARVPRSRLLAQLRSGYLLLLPTAPGPQVLEEAASEENQYIAQRRPHGQPVGEASRDHPENVVAAREQRDPPHLNRHDEEQVDGERRIQVGERQKDGPADEEVGRRNQGR